MDKYEYKVKTEQMLEYVNQGQYKEAMEIADTIDWRRVKNSSMLSRVSEIYDHEGEYQKSRDILLLAYDRTPESREIVYNLGLLALKVGDVDEASDCYEEFVKIAPKDPSQYLLKYQILKAQHGAIEDEIAALEEYKKGEYTEEWGYELAKLYDEAGMTNQCLDECDDLVLWFSEGEYVYKAMELKMKYKPLTPLQQDKYDHRFEAMAAEAAAEASDFVEEYDDEEEAEEAEEAGETEEAEETGEAEEAEEDEDTFEEAELPDEADAGAAPETVVTEEETVEAAPEAGEEADEEIDAERADIIAEFFPDEEEEQEAAAPEEETAQAKDEEEEPDGFKHSSITTVVTGATLEEALANGMAVASGTQAKEKAVSDKDEEMRVSGQMQIDEILQEWEEKQKTNAEAIEKQKAEDEARISEERAAAEKRKEAERLEVEKKAAEAEEARKAAAAEAARKQAEEEAAAAAAAATATAAAATAAAEAEAAEAEADTQKLPDDIQELVAQLENRVSAQEAEEPDEEEEEEIEAFDTEEELELEQVEKLDMPTEDDYKELEAVLSDYDDDVDEEDFEEDIEEDIEEDFEEENDGQVAFRLDEETEEEEEAEEEEEEEEEAEEITEDVLTAEAVDEAVEEAEEEDVEEVDEEDFEEEDFEEEDFEEEDIEEVDEEDFEEEDFEEEDLEEPDEEEFEEEDFEEEEEDETGSDDLGENLGDEFADFDEDEFYDDDDFPEDVEEGNLEIEEPSEEEIEQRIDKTKGGVPFDTGFVVTGRYDLSATSEIGLKAGLTEEQKKLFSYFVPVRGMSEQIVEVLDNDRRVQREGTSKTGNLLIIGRPGSGKTVLAVDIVKAIQKQRNLKQGKVAIVTGESLNKKELTNIIQKLKGGAIIVEKAGKLNTRTIKELSTLMEKQTGEMLFVLEDQRKPLERILTANPDFRKKFTSKLELPIFINDELVTFGQTYAKENGYKLDEMGILALYSRIDVMQREDHAVSVAEVKEIMDEAIDHSQKANVKHLARRVFGKSTDDTDRIILKEEDFKV